MAIARCTHSACLTPGPVSHDFGGYHTELVTVASRQFRRALVGLEERDPELLLAPVVLTPQAARRLSQSVTHCRQALSLMVSTARGGLSFSINLCHPVFRSNDSARFIRLNENERCLLLPEVGFVPPEVTELQLGCVKVDALCCAGATPSARQALRLIKAYRSAAYSYSA